MRIGWGGLVILSVLIVAGCEGGSGADAGVDAGSANLCGAPVANPPGLRCFSPLPWTLGARNTKLPEACVSCASTMCATEATTAFGPAGVEVDPASPAGACTELLECAAECECGNVECHERCQLRVGCTEINRLIGCLRDNCESDCVDNSGECGDGILQSGEQCDPRLLPGSCRQVGMADGILSCGSTCFWDERGCVDRCCGDGVLDRDEECDLDELDGLTCEALGFDGGELACTGGCALDSSGCVGDGGRCGDDFASEALGERCDGEDRPIGTCADLGYTGGEIGCTDDCQSYDFTSCVPREVAGSACADPIAPSPSMTDEGYLQFLGNTVGGSNVEEGSCGGADGPEEVFTLTFPGSGQNGAVFVVGPDGQRLADVVYYLRESCDASTEVSCSTGSGPAAVGPLSADRTYLLFVDGPAPLPAFRVVYTSLL